MLFFSAFWSGKLIKKSVSLIKMTSKTPSVPPQEIFQSLVIKAVQDFRYPQKAFIWITELSDLTESLTCSTSTLTLFLNSLSLEELKDLWEDFDLIIYWHIIERGQIRETLEILNPSEYSRQIERLDAKISHNIMTSFKNNPVLLHRLNNFIFFESINQKKNLE